MAQQIWQDFQLDFNIKIIMIKPVVSVVDLRGTRAMTIEMRKSTVEVADTTAEQCH